MTVTTVNPHVGDIGAKLQFTIIEDGLPLDLTGATPISIDFVAPSGAVQTFDLTTGVSFVTDGTDGKIQYTTAATTDLNEAGLWHAEVQFTLAGWNGTTTPDTFTVDAVLN